MFHSSTLDLHSDTQALAHIPALGLEPEPLRVKGLGATFLNLICFFPSGVSSLPAAPNLG